MQLDPDFSGAVLSYTPHLHSPFGKTHPRHHENVFGVSSDGEVEAASLICRRVAAEIQQVHIGQVDGFLRGLVDHHPGDRGSGLCQVLRKRNKKEQQCRY